MRAGIDKVEDEVIYAGLQETRKSEKKFKRNEKFSTKYTKERQSRRKRKGKFGWNNIIKNLIKN